MDFNAAYPWFGEGFAERLGSLSVRRYEFVPIVYRRNVEEVPASGQRSTLRMEWKLQIDADGRMCLRARWDARRRAR